MLAGGLQFLHLEDYEVRATRSLVVLVRMVLASGRLFPHRRNLRMIVRMHSLTPAGGARSRQRFSYITHWTWFCCSCYSILVMKSSHELRRFARRMKREPTFREMWFATRLQ